MNVIIYGIGYDFNRYFEEIDFYNANFSKITMQIIGLSDSNSQMWGRVISFCGIQMAIQSINSYDENSYEGIIITSNKYYGEIRSQLINSGIEENKIYTMTDFWKSWVNKIFRLDFIIEKRGIEIGGPSGVFSPIYQVCKCCDGVNFSNKTVWWKASGDRYIYKEKDLGNMIISDAVNLSIIKNESYDFVLSSNNLEHIANPLLALNEFTRICNKNGIIIILVPKKEKCFDHNREYTDWKHILEDYINKVGEEDMTHLPEIIDKHDYEMDRECGGKEKFIERAKKNVENRCLHHHVFGKESLRKMFEYMDMNISFLGEIYNNYMIVGEKN